MTPEQSGVQWGQIIPGQEEAHARAVKAARAELAEEPKRAAALAGTLLPAMIEFNPRSRQRQNAWSSDWPDKLWPLTPEEYEQVPDGSTLVCIDGRTKVKGTDYIDQDTRGGYIAFGFLDSQLPPWREISGGTPSK